MIRGLLDRLRERRTPTVCPGCGSLLVNLGALGLYCPSCGSILGNIPTSGTFMVIGEPGSGKTMFLYNTVSQLVHQARPCVFIACDQEPSRVRQSIKGLGYPMFVQGGWGSNQFADFVIVDAFSGTTGLKSGEEYAVEGLYDLNEMSITLSNVCERMKNQCIGVFLDSANPLFMHRDADVVMRFLHLCGSRVVAKGGSFHFTLTPGVAEETVQRKLESIVDGILEMRILQEMGKSVRQFRLKKMRGKKIYEDWVAFEILPGMGMVFRCVTPNGSVCLFKL